MIDRLAGYTMPALAFLATSALLAGLARGFSGFGAALIFIPLASTVVSTDRSPRRCCWLSILVMARRPHPRRMASSPTGATSASCSSATLIGVPIGAGDSGALDPIAIRWMIAMLVRAVLALLMSGWRYRGKPARRSRSALARSRALQRSRAGRRPADRRLLAEHREPAADRPRQYRHLLCGSASLTALVYPVRRPPDDRAPRSRARDRPGLRTGPVPRIAFRSALRARRPTRESATP